MNDIKDIFIELENKFEIFKKLEKEIVNVKNDKNDKNYIKDKKKYYDLRKEMFNYITYKNIVDEINKTKDILKNKNDFELEKLVKNEIEDLEKKKNDIEIKILKEHLNPLDNKINSIFFEIRSASGGNEASIFVKDLFKMYSNYFEIKKWTYQVLSISYSTVNGYKEIIIRIEGKNVFNKLKTESGIHRVQRIPFTESNGRIHTSTCTVAVLPEIKQIGLIEINQNDLRIDTYRASGAGGQHVNMTDSAVRITHIPTGIVAECQNERSQHKNKSTALSLLKSKLEILKKNELKNDIDTKRRNLIGSGARSEKIRTYNFVQNRITDHRINLTLRRLNDILNGNLDLIIDNLKKIQ